MDISPFAVHSSVVVGPTSETLLSSHSFTSFTYTSRGSSSSDTLSGPPLLAVLTCSRAAHHTSIHSPDSYSQNTSQFSFVYRRRIVALFHGFSHLRPPFTCRILSRPNINVQLPSHVEQEAVPPLTSFSIIPGRSSRKVPLHNAHIISLSATQLRLTCSPMYEYVTN